MARSQANRKKLLRHTCLAVMIAIVFLLLTSFAIVGGNGRYQIEAWAFPLGNNAGQYGAFVLDTTTGKTRLVYHAEYRDGRQSVIINRLDKAFHFYENNSQIREPSIKELKKQPLN